MSNDTTSTRRPTGRPAPLYFTRMVSSKGQISIPKATRDAAGVGPGDYVVFDCLPDGFAARFVRRAHLTDYLLEVLAAATQRLLVRRREGHLDLQQPEVQEDLTTIGDVLEQLTRRRGRQEARR